MNNKIVCLKNQILHFYCDVAGICLNNLSSPAPHPEIIFSDGYFDFDVVCDNEGIIHLICQDKYGSIVYLIYNENLWHKRTLFISKTKTAYIKSFKILSCGKLVYALYTVVKDSKPMLVFQCLNAPAPPVVIDYITPSPRSFFVFTEKNNDIYIYYQNTDLVLGCKCYIWSKKDFGPFNPLLENANCPFAIDKENIIAVEGSKIMFISNNEKHEIYNSFGNEFTPPAGFVSDNNLCVFWQQANIILNSKRFQNTFSHPTKLLSPYSAPELFEIKTSPSNCVYLYGSARKNDIRLLSPASPVTLKDFFNLQNKPALNKPDDKLDIILDKLDLILKLLKGGV